MRTQWLVAFLLLACGGTASPLGDGGIVLADGGGSADGGALAGDAGLPTSDGGAGSGDAGTTGLPAGFAAVPYLSATPVRSFTQAAQMLEPNRDYVAVLETDAGRMTLELYEVETPVTVNSFVFLALNRFYEGVAFHRVIDNFMAQTGDPNSAPGGRGTWGTGGPGYSFGLEVNAALTYDGPGVLGMARATSPNSNGSQFFITFGAYPSLNQQYTVWGRVTDGLDVLARITRGEPPAEPTRIVRVVVGVRSRP